MSDKVIYFKTSLSFRLNLKPNCQFFSHSGNICRDSAEGERKLVNPSKTFTQSNGVAVSCGELQEWVQDVAPSGGAPGEATYCQLVQYVAWQNCDCIGPDIPSPFDDVKDLNPVCNLCGNSGLDFDFVPAPNKDKLTDTGCCGRQNCEILYYAASKGGLTANLCASIQEMSGPDCCNLTIIEPPSNEDNNDNVVDEEENEEEKENIEEDENEEETGDEDDDEIKCEDDPTFAFKKKKRKNCDWVAAKKKIKRFCRRKSDGERVWKSCPRTCGKCPESNSGI